MNTIEYRLDNKNYTHQQLKEKYGDEVENAIKKLGFEEILKESNNPKRNQVYERNGKKFTRQQLVEKYGPKVDDAIDNLGFKQQELERLKPVEEYEFNGQKFTRQQLDDKYGDKVKQAISSIGFKNVSPQQHYDNFGNDPEEIAQPLKKKGSADLSSQDPALASSGNIEVAAGSSVSEKSPEPVVTGIEGQDKQEASIQIPPEGDKTEVGFFKDLWNETISGITRTMAGAYGIKNFLNKQEAALLLSVMPDKYSEALNKMTPKQREIFINNAVNVTSPLGKIAGQLSADAQDELTAKTNEIAARTIQFEGNIVDDIASGNYAQAGHRTLKGVANSASSVALALSPGGLVVIGAGTAAQKQETLEEEGEDINVRTVLNSTINGAAEGIMERYTGKIAGSTLRALRGKAEAAKHFSEGIVKTILKDIGIEAGSEAATSVIQDLSDKIVQGREISLIQIMKNAADGAIIGGAMGGGISAPKGIAGYVAHKTMKKEKQNAINDRTAEAIQIENTLDNPELSDQVRTILEKKVETIRNEVKILQEGEIARAESMTDEQVKNLFQVDKEAGDLVTEIIRIEESESIDPQEKESLLRILHSEFDTKRQQLEQLQETEFEKLPEELKEKYIEEAQELSKEYMEGNKPSDDHLLWAASKNYFEERGKSKKLVDPTLESLREAGEPTVEPSVKNISREQIGIQDENELTNTNKRDENIKPLSETIADEVYSHFPNELVTQSAETVNSKNDLKNKNEFVVNGEQASTQARSKNLVAERIMPEKIAAKSSPKKLPEIISKVSKDLKASLIYGRSGRARSIGTYSPSNTLVRIKNAGDIDTVAHELGHYLDDRFDIIGKIPSDIELAAIRQLKWFSERGGSNPPGKLSKAQKQDYLQREGLAELIRAFVANPTQAKIVAPELMQHFENTIDKKTLESLREFSDSYLDIANATAGERILANVESSNLKDKPGFKKWVEKFQGEDGKLNITPFDRINSHLLNSMGIAEKAFSFLTELSGKENLKPSQNFEVMARVFAGFNGKVHRALSNGLVDHKNRPLTDSKGDAMNVKWLLDPLENTNEATIKKEMDEVIALLVAERTMEYSKKFQGLKDLTGIGAGLNQDIEVAQNHLNEFKDLKNLNPEKYDRIKEASRRYREFADAGLKYAVGKGRISQEAYLEIKNNNEYYTALTRVKENAPTEEALAFVNETGGSISSSREIIQKAKGGTGFIQNPYVSLLQNTVAIMRESDRNEVMQSFVEPLTQLRNMGDGTPIDFSQIARPAQAGDKNTRTVYVNGQRQNWQFSEDIYKSLSSLEGYAKNPIIDILGLPASLIRFTVTRFPVFALRNATRDTSSRLIVTRSNGNLKDLIHNADDKALFELYGGSQAGFYLLNKDSYRDTLKGTIKEIANNGGIVLDPGKLGTKYFELLEKGENINRVAEFNSARKKALKEGLNEYEAGIYAAYQARDLMDFAVAGHTIRTLNKVIPFLNAGVQGVRRSGKAIKENPGGFAVRTAIYTLLPQFFTRLINHLNGDDEEYEQLPTYQKDLFWNFKLHMLGDFWISIPKPFDLGIPSSIVDRSFSKIIGNDNAFEGLAGSIANMAMPFDESSMLGGMKPLFEAGVNYNMLNDRPIVPQWEEGKMMELRNGAKDASRVGEGVSAAFKKAGMSLDPRKIDHVIKGYGTYMADWGLSLSELGVDDSKFRFTIAKTGFAKDIPITNSVAVSKVYELATELGKWSDSRLISLRNDIEKFYEAEDGKARKEISSEIYKKAEKLRKEFEADKKKIKEPETEKETKSTGPQVVY